MGYTGTKNRMHCYRRQPKQDAPLMESEQIKGGDPSLKVTFMVSEASNPALAKRHHEVSESVTMSHVSKEEVDDEEEEEEEEKERSFSQDLALLFFVEQQKGDTLSSEEESNLNIPDDALQDCKNPSLNCHQGKHASSSSTSTHQYSLVHTTPTAQVLSAPINVTQNQVQTQAFSVRFPQVLNAYDTFPQAQTEETVRTDSFPSQEESDYERPWLSHDTSCHQNAESSDPKSDEDQSVDIPHWTDVRLSQEMEATWGTDEEMSSEVEGAGTRQLHLLTTDNEKVRELNGLREDVKTSAPSQQHSGFSDSCSINIDGIQAMAGGTFSLSSSERVEDNAEEEGEVVCLRPNPFVEEEGTGEERAHSQRERMTTKHAKSNRSSGELGPAQKELPERVEPDPAEMEAQRLVETELSEEEEDLGWKEAESKIHTEQEKLASGHSNQEEQEEQEGDMQVQESFRKGVAPTFACALNVLSNLEKNLVLPDLETEGFICPSQEALSLDHCAGSMDGVLESGVHTATAKSLPVDGSSEDLSPVNDSPWTQSSKYHDSGQREHSGIQNHSGCISYSGQFTEGGQKHYFEKEGRVNAGDGKHFHGEGMAPSCKDLLGIPDPLDPNHSRPASHPVDAEIHSPSSLVETTTAISPPPEEAGKGNGNDTVGYVVLHEGSDPIQEPPNQDLPLPCQLDIEACGEVSIPNTVDVHTHCKNDTSRQDSHEEVPGSVSDVPQSTVPGGRLPDIDKENVHLNLVSSMSEWDPASFQAQDPAMNYLKKYQQYLKPPVRNFVFPGKEVEADALSTVQRTPINESPCCLLFEEDSAVCDCHTDSLSSPSTLTSIATDVTQLTRPLTPVPVSDQTLSPESASNHFSQPTLPMLECKQTVLFSTPPLNEDFLAQLPDPNLDPMYVGQLLKLPFPSQTCPFSVLKPAAIEAPQSSDPTPKLLDQSLTLESCSNEHSQLPDLVPNSDQSLSLEYDDHESLPKPILLTTSKNALVPALHADQLIQTPPFSQTREVIASELNTSLVAQVPISALNSGLHNLPPASTKPPIPDDHQFAQQQDEAPVSNLPINYIEDKEEIHTPIASFSSQTTASALEPQSLVQTLNTDGRVEKGALGQLAKTEGASIFQDPEDLNVYEASGNVEANLLGIQSDFIMLSKELSHGIPETMGMGTDVYDGKASSDHTSHPSMEGQKMSASAEAGQSMHPTPLLAFTNPSHFFQLRPPSPPTTRHLCRPPASQGPQWWQQQTGNVKTDASVSVTRQQMEGGSGTFRKESEKSVKAMAARVQKKERAVSHPPLEKSSSCPGKSVMRLDIKEPESNSKRQEGLPKLRTKSKDWHRQGVRKVSIPTDNALAEAIASLVPSKEEAHAHQGKPSCSEQSIYGEKKPAETVENIKRRHSKLINSSRLLYQEYSDVALNKAIQSQKRADSISEELDPGSPSSPRLRRKVLTSQDSYLQRLSVSSSTSLWQDIPMVRGSTMLLSMTREEQKLQEAKFELIASEASYLRSLNIAVDHFQHSQELQAVLTNQDRQWLFSRLQDVRDVSANFLFDLEEKLEDNMFTFNVCDVALRHAPEFRRVYLPYVTNQTYQDQTFRRLLNGLPAFQQVLEKLESDPVCQRLSLKSFLILPFQRITRLKLLLQNILKRTRPGAAEEVQATQAYDALEKLIKDCNENVQRMKSTEELIYLSQNMEFECKIFPLISQSRHLIKHGELTALEYNISLKWKLATRPIYLHLFNDYLLLSRPRENGRFIVFDYAAFSDVRGEKCEMKLHGANKNVFRLFLLRNNQGKKVEFLFRTETQSEKLRWISALTSQQKGPDLLDDSDAPQVQCVKSYKARENDELALEKADIIMVLRQSSDGWIEGVKLSDGERGWFPLENVEIISSKHARQMNLKEEQRVKYAKQQIFHRK